MKPGYKTTELLVVVLTNLGLVIAASASWLPPKYAAFASALSSAAYALSRGLAKLNTPSAPPAPPAA